MIKWFASLIRRIIGRIKENMVMALLSFGVMLIPLGYFFLLQGSSKIVVISGESTVVVGIFMFITAMIMTGLKENHERNETKERFDILIKEIRALRGEFNGGNKNNKQNSGLSANP